MALEAQDIQLIADEVARFAHERILPQSARHEHTMAADVVNRLLAELADMGVLPPVVNEAPDAPGLWADTEDAGAVHLSLTLLREIGRANAAMALAAHRQALARWLLRQFPPPWQTHPEGSLAMALSGHHGLARDSLGRWLSGHQEDTEAPALTAQDSTLLADWLDHQQHDTHVWAAPHWQQLIWPIWVDARVQWALMPRQAIQITPRTAPHGLQELAICTVRSGSDSEAGPLMQTTLDASTSRHIYASLLKMEFMGLMAIGLGTLMRGGQVARDFAAIRRQGGAMIEQHPAVQIMLADISATENTVHTLLAGLARPLSTVGLAEVASLRYTTSEPLVQASHQVMQVHGGIGYMRDVGPEKWVRDQNMLRLASGGAHALPLFISGLKGRP